jgi:hypothetical protein
MPLFSRSRIGIPNPLTPAAATAYQATNSRQPAVVTVNLTSAAALTLSGGSTNSAQIVIGATNAVAAGTGTVVGLYSNSNTGSLSLGLNISTVQAVPVSFSLPVGWFWAWRITAGTVTVTSAFDQAIG